MGTHNIYVHNPEVTSQYIIIRITIIVYSYHRQLQSTLFHNQQVAFFDKNPVLLVIIVLPSMLYLYCTERLGMYVHSHGQLVNSYKVFPYGAFQLSRRCYLWSGCVQDFSEGGRSWLASTIEIFDPYLETWQQHSTTGVPPPGLYNSLHRLVDLTAMEWRNYSF